MKKIVFSLFITLLTGLLYAQPIQVVATHPRLLLTPATITTLQSRATANTPEWQQIQSWLANYSTYSSAQLLAPTGVYSGEQFIYFYSLKYYATGNLQARDSAVSLFREVFYNHTNNGDMGIDVGYYSRSTMYDVAVWYDWLYNFMTPQFRTDVRNRLIYWSDWILYHQEDPNVQNDPYVYGQFGADSYHEGSNYSVGHMLGVTAVGYAIQTEDAVHGNSYIHITDSIRNRMIMYANTRLNNGDAAEGWGYGAGWANNFFKTLAIIKTASLLHTDWFASCTYDEGVMKFLPNATLPDLDHMLPEGDWAREPTGKIWNYNKITADIISSYSNTVNTQRIARFWGNETIPLAQFEGISDRWHPFLFANQEIAELDYRTVAPYTDKYLYTDTMGTDQYLQRTGWGTNDQWMSYRGGGRLGDHGHNGAGHFSLYENGWLLIDRNIQDASGIQGQDSSHNVVQIEDMSWREMYPVHDYGTPESTIQKRIEIVPDYTYFWSDFAPIYIARNTYAPANRWNVLLQKERQFFYLPGIKKIAVYDMAETEAPSLQNNPATNGPNYTKKFKVNFPNNPTLGSSADYLQYSNPTTSVYVTTCYPLNPSIAIADNSALISHTGAPAAKNRFMHLIHTQPVGQAKISVLPVTQASNNVQYSDFYGSFHQEASDNYVLLFNGNEPAAQDFDSVSYLSPITSTDLKNYLLGVEPNHTYYVTHSLQSSDLRVTVHKDNSNGGVAHTATDAGVLYFDFDNLPAGIPEFNQGYANIYYGNGAVEIKSIEDMGDVEFTLVNQQGQVIKSSKQTVETEMSVATGTISAGIYIANIVTQKGVISRKLYIH